MLDYGFDIIGITLSAIEVYNNREDPWAKVGLALDIFDLASPISFTGEVFKLLRFAEKMGAGAVLGFIIKHGDEAAELATKHGDEAVEMVAKHGDEVIEGGTHLLPNAEDLKMSQTVQNHMNDVIKKGPNAGQLSRPYIDSDGTTLLLKEIMESADPVPDAILQSGLRWDVSGTFRGSTGTWELVVDTSTNTVVHFNFVAQ